MKSKWQWEKKKRALIAVLKPAACWLATSCLQRADRAAPGSLTSSSYSNKYIKYLLALPPCIPSGWTSRKVFPAPCVDVTRSTDGWEALLAAAPLHAAILEGWFSAVLRGCVPGIFSPHFQFQWTSKEEDTPINVLHDNKLGKHHFWIRLMEDWLLPVPSGRLSWDYQMMSVVL